MEDGHTSNKAFERETTLATLLKASKSFRTYAVRVRMLFEVKETNGLI